MSRTLMVIASEAISEWLAKGEIVDRYYNPGNTFDELLLVLTNDDRPDRALVQRLAGSATVDVRNFPTDPGLFRRTVGYRPALLRTWAEPIVELARSTRPDVVRCYGANLNALAAAEVGRVLQIPFAVSLHINPDADVRGRASGREGLVAQALRSVERYALRRADIVLPVYRSIVPYLERIGVARYHVAYNMLNDHIVVKHDHSLHNPVRVISVGRQFDAKNPERLIRAVASLDDVHLTLVGDGPLHEHLRRVAAGSRRADGFTFRRSVENTELCRLLADQDVFATHSDYWELSKAVIEAFLTGLPVVLNKRPGPPVPELEDAGALLVDDDPRAWADALRGLVDDPERRTAIARAGAAHARREWAPEATEAALAGIYERLMRSARSAAAS